MSSGLDLAEGDIDGLAEDRDLWTKPPVVSAQDIPDALVPSVDNQGCQWEIAVRFAQRIAGLDQLPSDFRPPASIREQHETGLLAPLRDHGRDPLLLAPCIVVEAFAGLAAQFPSFHQLALERVRPIARLAVGGFVHRNRRAEVDVQADQVHQFERAHRKTATHRDQQVDVCMGRTLLADQPQRLGIERPRHAVDDEPGRVPSDHRSLPPGRR